MVKVTFEGVSWYEPPYSPEEEAWIEKALYGDIQAITMPHRPTRPEADPPASKQKAHQQPRKARDPS
jgi:hypothetical protein